MTLSHLPPDFTAPLAIVLGYQLNENLRWIKADGTYRLSAMEREIERRATDPASSVRKFARDEDEARCWARSDIERDADGERQIFEMRAIGAGVMQGVVLELAAEELLDSFEVRVA